MPHPACHLPVFLSALLPLAILAQEPLPNSPPPKPVLPVFASAREAVATVTERGAHHRVEQWVERILGEDGTTNDVTHAATVLANGMHYLDGGEWKETVPEFVPVNGGWLAARGPHQVLVSTRLFVAGAVTVVSPEGQTWRSTPMTLALRDRAGGQVWVLGESRDVAGELATPNTVLFRDAFAGETGLKADVRVVTSAGGVECDVIVRSGVPSKEALGEAGEHAELVVLTEIFEPGGASAMPVDRGGRSDDVVRLGALTMDQGQAFGTDLPGEPTRSVPVFKRVYQDEPSGRVFLEEATPLDSLTPLLEALPEARVPGLLEARWRNTAGKAVLPVRLANLSPAPSLPRRADGRFEVAAHETGKLTFAAVASQPGVVLDWSYLNSATNFTFRGDTTYRVTNAVTLSGTNVTFEGGTVIKSDAGVNGSVSVASGVNFDWQAEPFRPVTFTAKDDDSVGDKITGSSGNPSGAYAATALFLNGSGRTNGLVLANLRVRHANYGVDAVYFGQNGPLTLRHGQFVKCAYPFKFQLGSTVTASYFLQNVLVTEANTLFKDGYYAKTSGQFLTVNGLSTWFASPYSPHNCTVTVADSILSAVSSVNVGTTNNCWVASNATNLFEVVAAGAYYLPGQSPVRGVVATQPLTSFDATSRATTLAPLVLTNVTTALTLSPWQTAGDGYTLGYHYDPVDWYASNVVVTNATLTLTNGVTVALGGTKGFQLDSGGLFVSTGSPLARNRLVGSSFVQDGTNGVTGSTFHLFSVTAGSATRPTATANFTDLTFSGPGKTLLSDQNCALASLAVADSRLFRSYAYVLPPATNLSQTITLQNNVLEGADLGFHHYYDSNFAVTFRHNLLRRGNLLVYYASQATDTQHPTWTLKDNLFDSATLQLTTVAYGNYYVSASHNGYTGSTAIFGGGSNKTSLTAEYAVGPLGRFYYPATGSSGSLTNLLDAGSVTNAASLGFYHHTTLAAGPREGTNRLDIGFHYPLATAAETLADTDQDGRSDWAEDLDRDGTVETGETDPNNADSDQDGALDGEELAAGTDPNSTASWLPKRLAVWSWDGTNWLHGRNDLGPIAPLASTTGMLTNGVATNGVHFDGTYGTLRYPVIDPSGRLNVRLDQGSLRFWFKPDWLWGNPTNWTLGSPRFFEVGSYNNDGWWAWYLEPQNQTGFGTELRLKLAQWGGGLTERYTMPFRDDYTNCGPNVYHLGSWTNAVSWHELTLAYESRMTLAHHNGNQLYVATGRDIYDKCLYWTGGSGVDASRLPTNVAGGLAFGTQSSGHTNPINGTFDGVESFNYLRGRPEDFDRQQVTWQITNGTVRQLQFTRPYGGANLTVGSGASKPWPLTLWRRSLGATNWGTALLTNSTAQTWTDTNVTIGATYEFKVRFTDGGLEQCRHFFAGVDMAPQHQRGNVILLVDSTLEPSLTNELATLRTNLVGDGWTVKQAVAPRHDDLVWTNNRLNLTNVVNLISSNTVSGTTNVVFLVGHVTIPYSGFLAADGHADHYGAWVADAFYGYTDRSLWTDATNFTATSGFCCGNPANDGKFDQDYLPGPPDFAVGRLDFARLPAFSGLTEVDLIKRYLAKDWRYRTNGIPTFGRVSTHLGNPAAPYGASVAQSFAGAAFGTEPGRVFNGFNLLDPVPADLGVHYNYAAGPAGQGVSDGASTNAYLSSSFANPAMEMPVTFRQVWFSYASDWARLNEFNRFVETNNWLRASLGWTNYGLATMGGSAWDFAPLGSGAPLAMTMTHGWEGQWSLPRFQSILGDPTLRLHRITSPSNPMASRSGSAVTLTWNPSPDARCGYFIYRSTNGLNGFSTPLNPAPTPALSFTDTTATTNLLYQIRAAKLLVTGSGSFTNLSQATFITVP